MGQVTARERLIRQLRMAHAGERAAADAYAGHWRSVRAPGEREAIARIEREERAHRVRVGAMLADLGAGPGPLREAVFLCIGRTLGALCHVSGRFCPMYGAGWIEGRNVQEYVDAAIFARDAGRLDLAEELLGMAEVEWDHEAWFRAKAAGHWLARVVPLWRASPPRTALRSGLGAPGLPAA
jgi:demethoxyubiquinone hydroxylase (CLK1/Coq7/Cat5 family)